MSLSVNVLITGYPGAGGVLLPYLAIALAFVVVAMVSVVLTSCTVILRVRPNSVWRAVVAPACTVLCGLVVAGGGAVLLLDATPSSTGWLFVVIGAGMTVLAIVALAMPRPKESLGA